MDLNLSKTIAPPWESQSLEGAEIMTRPQPFVTKALLLIVGVLILSMLVLGVLGKTDIVVTALGSVTSAKSLQKVYTPVSGEIVDIFANEGAIVHEGDVLARIYSRDAIQMASVTEKKKAQLDQARFEKEVLWPEKRKLRLKAIETNRGEIRTLSGKINAAKKDYDNLPQATRASHRQHKMALAEAEKEYENQKLTVKESETSLEKAGSDNKRYLKLYKITAVSKEEYEEKKNIVEEKKYALKREINTLKAKENNVTRVQLKMDSFLMKVGSKLQKAEEIIQKYQDETTRKKLEILKAERDLEDKELEVNQKLLNAGIDYETMSKVRFENIDEDQSLRLLSPCNGEITFVAISQIGEMVKENTPLMTIGPTGSEKILKIKIQNQDRGFIRVGQKVKVKLDAFPYQRYGMIEGVLQTISPDVVQDIKRGPCYLASVKLNSSAIYAEGEYHQLNYGMTAKAEIVVRRQRIISYLLDPFKRI